MSKATDKLREYKWELLVGSNVIALVVLMVFRVMSV